MSKIIPLIIYVKPFSTIQSPEHSELMNRLRKTLYYGGLKMPQCKVLTKPLSDLVCNRTFDETHPENKLAPETVGQIKASPCSLILALIYLDLLKELDSQYVRRVPPSDLLLVAMVSEYILTIHTAFLIFVIVQFVI